MTMQTPERIAGEVVNARIAQLDLGDDIEPTLYNFFAALNTGWLDASNLESILYSLAVAAIEADRAQQEKTLVVIARGQDWTDSTKVEFLDVDPILNLGREQSGYSQEEVDDILATLREHGWESIAEDVEEAWVEPVDGQGEHA